MQTINVGSKEIVSCLLTDKLENVTTIPSADYKVVSEDEVDTVVDWAVATNIDGMRVDCLLDTSTGSGIGGTDPWVEGTYKLYVRCDIPPEAPIVGPFEFGVS